MTDLKPENVFLLAQDGQDDFVKIVDFGIAKVTKVSSQGSSDTSLRNVSREEILKEIAGVGDSMAVVSNVTLPGTVLGTPRYMPPEAVEGRSVDSRADQYSLGCLLYELLTGKTPFESRSTAGMLMKHLTEEPKSLRSPPLGLKISESLDALVLRLLAKNPDERFAAMRDVEAALTREIDLILVARGEKVVLPSDVASAIAGKGFKAALVIGKLRIPLWALVPVAALLIAGGGLLTYRLVGRSPTVPTLKPGELLALRQRAIELLKADVEKAPPLMQSTALTALGQSQESGLRSLLEPMLGNAPELQVAAAGALAELGDRQAGPALAAVLDKKPSPTVQAAVALSLRRLGDPKGQATLDAMLAGTDPEGQFRAALALCEKAPPKARELLGKYLKSGKLPEPVKLELLTCLAQSGEKSAQDSLREQAQADGPPSQRLQATARLVQTGDQAARESLRDLVRKKDRDQLLAARLLAGPDEPLGRELFQRVIADRQADVAARKLSAEGLGAIAEAYDARLLGTLLGGEVDPLLRQAAAAAIVVISTHDPATMAARSLAWAQGALFDKDWLVRSEAAAALGSVLTKDALALLAKLLDDPDPRVRQSAAVALGRGTNRAALRVLHEGIDDSEAPVRVEVLRSLDKVAAVTQRRGDKTLAPMLVPWLKPVVDQGPPTEKLLALGILAKIGAEIPIEELLKFKDAKDPELRKLLVETIEGRVDILVAALGDPDFGVRFAAARRLAELGDARAIPVLREALGKGGAVAIEAYALLAKLGQGAPKAEDLAAAYDKTSGAERLAAVRALGLLQPALALPLLSRAARDSDPAVRKLAADIAAALQNPDGSPAGLAILQLLAGDADLSVRARAQALLAKLTQKAGAADAEVEPPPSTTNVDAGAGAGTTKSPSEPKPAGENEDGKGSASNEPDAAAGMTDGGLLVLKAPDYVQAQLDKKPWQFVTNKPTKLAAGGHKLTTMSGKQEVAIVVGKTTTLELKPSPIEEAAAGGVAAAKKNDFGKATKLLERAISRCARAKALAQPCSAWTAELNYYLATGFESQGRLEEAAKYHQQVIDADTRGRLSERQRDESVQAMQKLSRQLGRVVVKKATGSGCSEQTIWVTPGGQQRVTIDGERKFVRVNRGEKLELGTCP